MIVQNYFVPPNFDPCRGQQLGVSLNDCIKLLCFTQCQWVEAGGKIDDVLLFSVCVSVGGGVYLRSKLIT